MGRFRKMMRPRARAALAALALSAALAACAPVYRNNGYVPSDLDLKAVVVGQSTRDDVEADIGRPASSGVLAGAAWYYVGSRFKYSGAHAPKEVDRQVVAISFDDKNVVSNVERFGLAEGKVVAISRRVTESNIRGIGFLRQLLGNLGSANTAQAILGQRGGGGTP